LALIAEKAILVERCAESGLPSLARPELEFIKKARQHVRCGGHIARCPAHTPLYILEPGEEPGPCPLCEPLEESA